MKFFLFRNTYNIKILSYRSTNAVKAICDDIEKGDVLYHISPEDEKMIIANLGRSGAINCCQIINPKKNDMYHKKQLSQITAIQKKIPLFEDMPILLKKFAKVRNKYETF